VTIKPAIRIKNIILETRHPALATPLKPNIPAITERTSRTTAIIINKLITGSPEKIIDKIL